jgi:hypothetical protein
VGGLYASTDQTQAHKLATNHASLLSAHCNRSVAVAPTAFWWEPLEMCRKLTLGGWVLLVGEESEYARILVALLISTSFLALFLNVKPQHRRVVQCSS